jgi:hypothetical protein
MAHAYHPLEDVQLCAMLCRLCMEQHVIHIMLTEKRTPQKVTRTGKATTTETKKAMDERRRRRKGRGLSLVSPRHITDFVTLSHIPRLSRLSAVCSQLSGGPRMGERGICSMCAD